MGAGASADQTEPEASWSEHRSEAFATASPSPARGDGHGGGIYELNHGEVRQAAPAAHAGSPVPARCGVPAEEQEDVGAIFSIDPEIIGTHRSAERIQRLHRQARALPCPAPPRPAALPCPALGLSGEEVGRPFGVTLLLSWGCSSLPSGRRVATRCISPRPRVRDRRPSTAGPRTLYSML